MTIPPDRTTSETVAEWTAPDGSLSSDDEEACIVDWSPGDATVWLDGHFTPAELEQIAAHMRSQMK